MAPIIDRSLWQRIVDAFREFLRRIPAFRNISYSRGEIEDLLALAAKKMRKKGVQSVDGDIEQPAAGSGNFGRSGNFENVETGEGQGTETKSSVLATEQKHNAHNAHNDLTPPSESGRQGAVRSREEGDGASDLSAARIGKSGKSGNFGKVEAGEGQADTAAGDGSKGWNYVAFSDKDIHVDEHIRFAVGENERNIIKDSDDPEINLAYPKREAKNISEALAALSEFPEEGVVNTETGIRGEIHSEQGNKLVSSKAREKSNKNGFDNEDHFLAVANIDRLFINANLVSDKPDQNRDPNVVSVKRFVAPILLKKEYAEAYITVKETVGSKIYSIELDELKKPSDIQGGTLKERYHIPEGYYKLLQKIEKARALIKNQAKFSVGEAEDAAYMDAVNRGDMETAQRMVNEAAKIAFPNTKVVDENGEPLVVYHGTLHGGFSVFQDSENGIWFTDDASMADSYADPWNSSWSEIDLINPGENDTHDKPGKYACFINITSPVIKDYHGKGSVDLESPAYVLNKHPKKDGIICKNIYDEAGPGGGHNNAKEHFSTASVFGVRSSEQIKSADPVTYDDNGNVIPLSKRFNLKKSDIRYSLQKRKQVNPIVVDGKVRKEYQDLLENKEYTPQTIAEWDKKAVEWIIRQGGIVPAAESILADTEHTDRHVATLVRKHVMNSDVFNSLPQPTRDLLEVKNVFAGTEWGREGVARRQSVIYPSVEQSLWKKPF